MKKHRFPPTLSYVYLCLLLLNINVISACSKDDKPLVDPIFSIAKQDLLQGFLKTASQTFVTINTNLSADKWDVVSNADWCSATQSVNNDNKTGIAIAVLANTKENKREAIISIRSSVQNYTLTVKQQGTKASIEDIHTLNDIKIKPNLAEDSDHQSGYDISKTLDGFIGEDDSFYHSTWGRSANFPVRLEYFFSGKEDIDYLIYRTRSGNGNFGKVDIYTATAKEPNYKLYGSFDFRQQNASTRIVFTEGLKNVHKIKFMVKSGLDDFVSCDEMEFFQKNEAKGIEDELLEVFTDLSCSEVKKDVTDSQIGLLPEYFADIALKLRGNTYDEWEKNFRIRDYAPYSDVEIWAEKLMTKRYSDLDNPTGIYAEKGDSLIVLVGDTHGHTITLQSIAGTKISGEYYFLKEGINKIGVNNTGMLYVMYTANPQEQPIRIHIPPGCGKVNGFFDVKEHKTDTKYAELLSKATYDYFCVRGDKMIFYFSREQLLADFHDKILSGITLWDDIVGWQQELMGIDDVRPVQVNNHLFAVSTEEGYMSASDYQLHFAKNQLYKLLSKDVLMQEKDNAWGPAHEVGHIHQKAINWPSSTESSNNLFSNYVIYKLGKYCSRGRALNALADTRFALEKDKRAWYNMGAGTHKNEDTEIHMRMNWQLWNYYHRCGYKPDFWQTLFKLLREDENRIIESDPGAGQLQFARMACKAANENLTDFFEMWGFFEPVDNVTYNQYGAWNYNVTQRMIEEAKTYMKQFPAPKHAFYYLEDRKKGDEGLDITAPDTGYYTQFKDNTKITLTPTASITGNTISISNGEQAVAFEVRKGTDGKGEILYFSNSYHFTVPASITTNGASLFAVQADGLRKWIAALP